MKTTLLFGTAFLFLLGCAHTRARGNHPVAAQTPVVDVYHDVSVTDDYRWLENWEDPNVKKWSNEQNQYAREYLNQLPRVEEIRARVTEIDSLTPLSYYSIKTGGKKLFAVKYMPPANQPQLVVFPSIDDLESETVVLDLNILDKKGSVSIDWYAPSPDGNLVAVSLSESGSEIGDVHVYETNTGKETGDVVVRVNNGTAGGDLAWTPDGSGFYYTRYPRHGAPSDVDPNLNQQLWFHELGKGNEDRYELGEDFVDIAEIEVDIDPNTGMVLASVQYGDSGRFAYYIRAEDGRWSKIIGYNDGIKEVQIGPDGSLFLVTMFEAPKGKVLQLDSADLPLEQAKRIVCEKQDTISTRFYNAQTMVVTKNRLYVTYQLGGPSEIRIFDHSGQRLPGPKIPPISTIGGRIIPVGEDDIMFSVTSFISPTAWYHYSAKNNKTTKTKLSTESPVNFEDVEVVRAFTRSKDGTNVPINILKKKGTKLDGSNPTLLTGYGGYGMSHGPSFIPKHRIWFDHGGVFAVANIRGGGEYGEKWHKDGTLTKKQNTFDDFFACMEYLVDSGHTTKDKLAIEGWSNGGLLMGAILTQHPTAMKAVVSHVGVYDMLRAELSSNGKFNIPEYGTVTKEAEFLALHAYSPYHNVENNTDYPAILFMTGAHDARVDPMHSRKMTARLQEANSSSNAILLRTSANTGHGGGAPREVRIEQRVDVLAFLFDQLGM